MPAPLVSTVSGTLYDPSGDAVSGAKVKALVMSAFTDAYGNYIAEGLYASTTTDANGAWSLDVIQTASLDQAVTFQFVYPLNNNQTYYVSYPAVIPNSSTASFSSIVDLSSSTATVTAASTTDNLAEGVVNLYHTDARSRAAISATSPISYNSTTGVISTSLTDITSTDDLAEGSTNLYYTNARADARITAQKGAANGLAPLASDSKIDVSYLPASVVGQVSYQGTWNASTNSPSLVSSTGTKGYYYVVSVAGSTNLDGVTDWKLGDWAIYNGSAWQKVDNTDAVTSVNGQTGIVSLSTSDISEGTNLYSTDARTRAALSATAPVTYNSSTGVIALPAATGSVDGYLSATTQTVGGAKTFTGDMTLQGNMSLTQTVNNSLSGANARVPSHTTATMVFTNASLTSIGSANNGGVSAGHTLNVINETGASITLVNAYASASAGEKIYTGTGADQVIPNHGMFAIQYNGTASAWSVISTGVVNLASSAVTGTLPIANGGTGQTSANNAINALLPTQTSNSGKYLTTDGSSASWGTVSTSSGTATVNTITQSSHGFSAGDVLYHNGTIFAKAKADSDSTADAIGAVSSVTDANTFVLTTSGYLSGLGGFTAGTTYYLSASTAGAITATEPTTAGYISKPIFIATSTTAGYVVNMRGVQISSTVSQLGLMGSIYITNDAGSTGGNWSRSSTSMGSFTAGSGNYTYTATNGFTTASSPATNLPAIKLSSLPAGTYKFRARGHFSQQNGATSTYAKMQFHDGTNAFGVTMMGDTRNGSGTASFNFVEGIVTYSSTQTNITVELQCQENNATLGWQIGVGNDTLGAGFAIPLEITCERIY